MVGFLGKLDFNAGWGVFQASNVVEVLSRNPLLGKIHPVLFDSAGKDTIINADILTIPQVEPPSFLSNGVKGKLIVFNLVVGGQFVAVRDNDNLQHQGESNHNQCRPDLVHISNISQQ